MSKKTQIKKLALAKETVQRLGVKTSVKTGRMIVSGGNGGTSWTSLGGSCDNCTASDMMCPTNNAL
jgi:hypothetical protein